MEKPTVHFVGFESDPDNPGWLLRRPIARDLFLDIFGDIRLHAEGERHARVRITPLPHHGNIHGLVHGGFLMAVIDQAYFLAPWVLGIKSGAGAATIDSTTQFLAPVSLDRPFDAAVEILRETGRLIFVRGLIEQDGTATAAFSGTVRKASEPR